MQLTVHTNVFYMHCALIPKCSIRMIGRKNERAMILSGTPINLRVVVIVDGKKIKEL